jgi:hypothetical protein
MTEAPPPNQPGAPGPAQGPAQGPGPGPGPGPAPGPAQGPGPSGTYYQQPTGEDPGRTLGIVGLILSFFTALIGLIVSAIGLSKSRKAGFKNTPALIGVIIGAIGTVAVVIGIIVAVSVVGAAAAKCAELGPGTHQEGGVTYRCG